MGTKMSQQRGFVSKSLLTNVTLEESLSVQLLHQHNGSVVVSLEVTLESTLLAEAPSTHITPEGFDLLMNVRLVSLQAGPLAEAFTTCVTFVVLQAFVHVVLVA